MALALSPTDRSSARPQPCDYLFRAATACVLARHAGTSEAARIAKTLYKDDPVTPILLKAAAPPATIGNAGWAGTVAHLSVSSLLQSIVSLSAAADLLNRALKISFDRLASIRLPSRFASASSAGSWLIEGMPIVVQDYVVSAGPTLSPHKLATIATLTREMVSSSNVEAVVRQLLSEAFALMLDQTLFGTQADTGTGAPAGLLNGVTPTVAATGTSAIENMITDIQSLIAALATQKAGLAPVFVGAAGQIAAMKARLGPKFDYPILASAGLAPGVLIVVEPASLAATIQNAVPSFDAAESAILHMESATPTDIVTASGTAAVPVKSLFQTDAIALRAILSGVSWAMRAPHVAFVSGTAW